MTDQCAACVKAEANPRPGGLFQSGCMDCAARHMAGSPVVTGSEDQIKASVRRVFGDQAGKWWPRVKYWAKRFKEAKK